MQFFAWIILTMLYEINGSHAGGMAVGEGVMSWMGQRTATLTVRRPMVTR